MISIQQPPQTEPKSPPCAHLSYSQLKCYATCSLKWQLSRIHEPEFVSSCLVFGSAFHKSLQCYYQGRLEGRTVTQDQMLRTFSEHWAKEEREIRYGKTETADILTEKAQHMLSAFYQEVNPGEVIAVEEPITFRLSEGLPEIKGYIDLIEVRDRQEGKALYLTDFKTAARAPSSASDMDADQLILYAMASQRLGILKQFDLPLILEYLVITKTKTPKVISLEIEPDKQISQRLIAKAETCYRGMATGICFPNPGWMCAGCGYKQHCQSWGR